MNHQHGVHYGTSSTRKRQDHARLARDVGSIALVLERVNELVNQCLCRPSLYSIPVYSIFSGQPDWGGQSLNVWDSIFKPDFAGSFFPDTATKTRADFPACYTEEALTKSMYELMPRPLHKNTPAPPYLGSHNLTCAKSFVQTPGAPPSII